MCIISPCLSEVCQIMYQQAGLAWVGLMLAALNLVECRIDYGLTTRSCSLISHSIPISLLWSYTNQVMGLYFQAITRHLLHLLKIYHVTLFVTLFVALLEKQLLLKMLSCFCNFKCCKFSSDSWPFSESDLQLQNMLPKGTLSLLVQPVLGAVDPISDGSSTNKGIILVASNASYAYSNRDRAWIRAVASKFQGIRVHVWSKYNNCLGRSICWLFVPCAIG